MRPSVARQALQLTAFIFVLPLFLSISCKKIHNTDTSPPPPSGSIDTTGKDTVKMPPELSIKVVSSVSGFVVSGGIGVSLPVEGATISFGNKTATTDEYGYFEIKNATVTKIAAQITASKRGFFSAYKTLITREGALNFERLQIMQVSGGTYSASSGTYYDGSSNGSSYTISIPPYAFVIAGTNTPFTGYFFFYSNLEEKNDNWIALDMPGDSRGIDSTGKLKLLTTNGLVWFDAEGINGEKLQLSKPATIRVNFSNITTTIPAWNYDSTSGLWRQASSAVPLGYGVECTIDKLGMWNFATPADYTIVSAKLVTTATEPIPFSPVTIGGATDPNATPLYKYADADGYISEAAPVNSSLSFDVHAPGYDVPIFSKKFNNARADISLGGIPVNTNDVFTITGFIVSCSGSPVSDGFLMINGLRFVPDMNGKVHFSTIVKNLGIYTSPGFLVAEETSTRQKSDNITLNLAPGNNDIGNISVCGKNEPVKVTGRLIDNAGNPLPNLFVTIVPQSDFTYKYTATSDSQGNVVVYTLENNENLITVYGSLNCGTPVFSTNLTTINRDTTFGTLTISGLVKANVSGSVVDCNNNPVTSGKVIVQKDNKNYYYPINSNGTFNFNIPVCNATNPEPVTIIAEDNTTSQTGAPVNFSLNDGSNSLGALNACNNNSTLEFMNFTIDATHYSLVSPIDAFNELVNPGTHWTGISGTADITGSVPGVSFYLTGTLAVGSTNVSIDEFDIGADYGRYIDATTPAPVVNITEYGPVGGYIAGYIAVKIQNIHDNSVHDATCSFRVKRKE